MYSVSVEEALPRALAGIRVRMPVVRVPQTFGHYLARVYGAAASAGVKLDGQNVLVYEGNDANAVDVTFGVGVLKRFAKLGDVSYRQTPVGMAATVTHWGDYAGLAGAHAAVLAWCREHGRTTTGARWEVYGHSSADPAKQRTDVFYLLAPA